MRLTTIPRVVVSVAGALLISSAAFAQKEAGGSASARFDGKWLTKLTCPPKGNTEGYTLQFDSVIKDSNYRGERGTAGEGGYLLIEGKIAADGSARLEANGIVASRKYARGPLAHKGEEYSYKVKAQFQDTEGTGTRDEGLGIVGRACKFDFTKQ
ncbi:MAG TPA: hypothetical protein VN893_00595 [Bryobacteraceae bacterium]|nr:hypothetical protein [Bryobacteraceae bacterium]